MSLWNQCLERLRQELPTQQFVMWIRPLTSEQNQDAVTLYAPNRFILDWVREKYRDKINQLFVEFSGGQQAPQLRFEVVQRRAAPAASNPAPSATDSDPIRGSARGSSFSA
ncbi:MAG TPA: chromosomal replication initiator protein DnaA, partial [Alteromonas sp.]|nr:chromosomal replication initiator protein DnaA [Alteromonas sp.]